MLEKYYKERTQDSTLPGYIVHLCLGAFALIIVFSPVHINYNIASTYILDGGEAVEFRLVNHKSWWIRQKAHPPLK